MSPRQSYLFASDTKPPSGKKPVNVASVPQRSPFRYPGGKTWFVPTFRKWLRSKQERPSLLIEPFAGGGIISLTAAFEELVDEVLMVELDEDVAAVWQTIVDGNAQWLAGRIVDFSLTRENVVAEISRKPRSLKERAFQTILKNRTLHGGILAEGSGFIKHGEQGKGIASRWYPNTLARRLRDIAQIAGRLRFKCDDGMRILAQYAPDPNVVYFIDPPYTASGKSAGRRLYRHFQLDHEKLFSLCDDLGGDFLLTYDNAQEVRELARRHAFQLRLIPMKNTHHANMEELVIGKDLAWLDDCEAVREPSIEYVAKADSLHKRTRQETKRTRKERR